MSNYGTITGAVFREQEDSAGYLAVLAQTAEHHGLPVGVYSDRHTIFWRGKAMPTLAGRAVQRPPAADAGRTLPRAGRHRLDRCAQPAGQRPRGAAVGHGPGSPQAKGRVERLWGTAQDRLLAELRLAGAATIEQANAVLADYLSRHNRRFAVVPANPEPAWRALSIKAGLLVSLPAVAAGAGLIVVLLAVKVGAKVAGVWPTAKLFGMATREANYTTLLMSTGLTFGTISALYGLNNGYIDQAAYTVLVTVVILSAVVPTLIATTFFQPRTVGPDTARDIEAAEEIDAGPLPRPRLER